MAMLEVRGLCTSAEVHCFIWKHSREQTSGSSYQGKKTGNDFSDILCVVSVVGLIIIQKSHSSLECSTNFFKLLSYNQPALLGSVATSSSSLVHGWRVAAMQDSLFPFFLLPFLKFTPCSAVTCFQPPLEPCYVVSLAQWGRSHF